jgi:urea transport system substrate-binding protein
MGRSRSPKACTRITSDPLLDYQWAANSMPTPIDCGTHAGAAWSPYLEGSKDLFADWVTLKCGNYNKVTKKCGGGS